MNLVPTLPNSCNQHDNTEHSTDSLAVLIFSVCIDATMDERYQFVLFSAFVKSSLNMFLFQIMSFVLMSETFIPTEIVTFCHAASDVSYYSKYITEHEV